MPWTNQEIEDAYDAMIECALWSSLAYGPTEQDDPIPADALFDESDIDPDLLSEWRMDIRAFMEDNETDLTGMNPEQIGHDFWLTRNGHGAGFWDRGLGERGDRLTAACKPYGETDPNLYYNLEEVNE